MKKTLVLLVMLSTKWLMATSPLPAPAPMPPVPAIECRFGALLDDGDIGLDQLVGFALFPNSGIDGDFEPYEFHLAAINGMFVVNVDLEGDPISRIRVPFANVVGLPIGATIFGVNTVFHPITDGFISLRYECIKVL